MGGPSNNNCLPGYFGANCTQQCPNCKKKGFNVEPNSCDRDTGFCICKPGWRSSVCQDKCEENYYGQNCVHVCNCAPAELCDHIVGCITNRTSVHQTTVSVVGTSIQTHTPVSLYITVTCGITGIFLLASVCFLKYRHIKRQRREIHNCTDRDIVFHGIQNISEYSEITEIDGNSDSTMTSDLRKTYDHLEHSPYTKNIYQGDTKDINSYDCMMKNYHNLTKANNKSTTFPVKQYYDHLFVHSVSTKITDNTGTYDHINL